MGAWFLQPAAVALVNAGLAWMIGLLCVQCWLRETTSSWQANAAARLPAAMTAGLVVCAVSSALSLWLAAAAMADLPILQAWPAVWPMLTTTHFGHAAAAGIAFVLCGMLVHAFFRQGRQTWTAAMTLSLLLFACARALAGHAAVHGPISLAVTAEWLHILFMGMWVGIVMVCGWLALAGCDAEEEDDRLATGVFLGRMSHWSTISLLGIAVTGALNAYRVLGSWRDLIDQSYGQILAVKLGLVVLAVLLGGYNRFINIPVLRSQNIRQETDSQRQVRRTVTILRIESVVLILVLIAAAILTASSPPASP